MKSNQKHWTTRQPRINYINKDILLQGGMKYGTRNHLRLQKSLCHDCYQRISGWDDDIHTAWLRYLNGEDREAITKGIRFSSFQPLKYQFRKHPCQKKIAQIRRTFRKVKTQVNADVTNYSWLLGLYFADGFVRNKSQLSFGLSMHEELIENKVYGELKEILSKDAKITREFVGNMRQIRTHSIEICYHFPKKDDNSFFNLWETFTKKQKLNFIAGYIDGDGSCAFDVGINSIQIFSKFFPGMLNEFKYLLSSYGYVSLVKNGCVLYLSPKVGLKLKPFLVKKDIKRPYNGSVDSQKALDLLKNGFSMRNIAKKLKKDRKTITLALKQVYGINLIQKYLDKNSTTK